MRQDRLILFFFLCILLLLLAVWRGANRINPLNSLHAVLDMAVFSGTFFAISPCIYRTSQSERPES